MVTISAPLASIAAAVSSRSLYFPVPTIKRERNWRPATVQVSSVCTVPSISASPDEMHDLQAVPAGQQSFAIGGTRHDFLVAFHRHLAPIQFEHTEQPGHTQRCRKGSGLAVQGQGHGVMHDRDMLI